MNGFLLLAGRFRMTDAQAALLELAGPAPVTAGSPGEISHAWGAAWCYGNRLEVVRSPRHPAGDPELDRLADVRSDMAMFCYAAGGMSSPRDMAPFVRREFDRQWAFCNAGRLKRAELISTGGRIVDGHNPGERLFLHLLSDLKLATPAESIEQSLQSLEGETELCFLLLSADMLIASSRYRDDGGLWYGVGESLRAIATQRLSIGDVGWSEMSNGALYVISRRRWEL